MTDDEIEIADAQEPRWRGWVRGAGTNVLVWIGAAVLFGLFLFGQALIDVARLWLGLTIIGWTQ